MRNIYLCGKVRAGYRQTTMNSIEHQSPDGTKGRKECRNQKGRVKLRGSLKNVVIFGGWKFEV